MSTTVTGRAAGPGDAPRWRTHDRLGPVEVPPGATWGARTERARRLGVSGRRLGDHPGLVRSLALVKAAAARANEAAGTVSPARARAIERAAMAVAAGQVADEQFVADPVLGGGWVAVNTNMNEVLAYVAGASVPTDPAEVNRSQSTADVCHTAARLAITDAAHAVVAEAGHLADAFDDQAAAAGLAPTLARTCLQDALAVPAALRFSAGADAVRRAADRLAGTLEPLDAVTLGATVVGTGTGAPAAYRDRVVAELATLTGRPLRPHPSPASALQFGDDLVTVSAAAHQLALAAAKLAADLRLLASGPTGGLGEVQLPAVLEGSTFFAGKQNPVVPETVLAVAIEVAAHHQAVVLAAGQAELDLHVLDGLAAFHTLDALGLLGPTLARLRADAVEGLRLDLDRCAALAAAAPTTPAEPRP